ncbi:699_t:CDS:2, partial [Gigaspora rosea]
LLVFNEGQKLFIWVVQSDNNLISASFYGHGFGICKKALNLVITNSTNKVLEDLLQQFINDQIPTYNNTASEQPQQEIFVAIENHNTKHVRLSNQDEVSEFGLKKKNKHQCTS